MKNILVLVNLSAGAAKIARLAVKVAQQVGAHLLLCNGFELPVSKPVYVGYRDTDIPEHFEEDPFLTIEGLADTLKRQVYHQYRNEAHQPNVNCLNSTLFNSDKLHELVIEKHVDMIITSIHDLLELNNSGLLGMIDKANCPVLVIPENASFTMLDSTAYVTDLRYCDVEVVRFLKAFNAKVFVTHVSSSGIPDMEDGYAQQLLMDTIVSKTGYNKVFLRNIKGVNRKTDLEIVTKTASIKFFTIVNRKHYVLERFLSDNESNRRIYHNLPLLIIPYPNWYRG